MLISCRQKDLSSSLSIAASAVTSRPINPIFTNILITADENLGLKLTAVNNTFRLETYCDSAHVYTPGEIALPTRIIHNLVHYMPEKMIEIELNGTQALIRSYSKEEKEEKSNLVGEYTISGVSGSEFPPSPEVKADRISLEKEAFLEGLRMVLFATSEDDKEKQILTGVHLQTVDDTLEFAATNGHRIAIANIPVANTDISIDTTIPSTSLQKLQHLVTKYGADEIYLYLNSNQADFNLVNKGLIAHRLTTLVFNETYPKYRKIVPQSFTRQALIDRGDLVDSLERLSILAGSKNMVKFFLNSDSLTLKTEMGEFGEGQENLPIEMEGEPLTIAFNINYILEGLKVIKTKQVQIQLNSPNQPAVFSPIEGTKMTYMVMPIYTISDT